MYYTTRYDIPIAGVVKMGQMEPAFVCFAVGAATRHDCDAFHLSGLALVTRDTKNPSRDATQQYSSSCSHEMETRTNS